MASECYPKRKRQRILTDETIQSLLESTDSESISDFDGDSIVDPTYSQERDTSSIENSDSEDEELAEEHTLPEEQEAQSSSGVVWNNSNFNFMPRKTLPNFAQPIIRTNIDRGSTELEVFFKVFPKSLFIKIADCTSKRIAILNTQIQNKNKKVSDKQGKAPMQATDQYEMMAVVGVYLVMAYNRLPQMSMYWSQNLSMGNTAIKNSISRDRFLFLSSKLYINDPEKPSDATKSYYVDEMVSCLKYTFPKCRTDSMFQSIDEAMAKFKGRSSLKQYNPMKPIKRGIKIWARCDSKTGYSYDLDIYCGRETAAFDGTLGERVVKKLCSTISNPSTVICCDRFFTTVNLAQTLDFGLVGTIMKNKKFLPNLDGPKLERGDYVFKYNSSGTMLCKWQDTKEVLLLTNCHTDIVTTVQRTNKKGEALDVACPEPIAFYNRYMGGVDLSDQFSSLYDPDRKSGKWWKRVFQKLLMVSVSNAWILFQETRHVKVPLISFLAELAVQLLHYGKERATIKRRSTSGRPSERSKALSGVGEHLPIEGKTRRRCRSCSNDNKEHRTKMMCVSCNIPLCKLCFAKYHTN